MSFAMAVFHRTTTSLQAHLAVGDEENHEVFALLGVHAPGVVRPYATLHVVAPEHAPALGPPLYGAVRELLLESLDLPLDGLLVTGAAAPDAGGPPPAMDLEIRRHRPTSTSSRDLCVAPADDDEAEALVAVLERFRDGDDTMNVLCVLDRRFRSPEGADALLRRFDATVGPPTGPGRHDLDVLYARLEGDFAARSAED